MLTVVQNQEQLPGSEVVREGLGQRASRPLTNSQSEGHSLGHESRLGQRRQLHHPHAVLEPFDQLARRGQSQPRLAASPRSSERQEAIVFKQPLYLGQLLLPSDEAAQLRRQVVEWTLRAARGGFRFGGFHRAKPPRVLWLLRSDAVLSGVRRCHHLLLFLSLPLSVAVVSNNLELRASSRLRCSDTTIRRYVALRVPPARNRHRPAEFSLDHSRPALLPTISSGPNVLLLPY